MSVQSEQISLLPARPIALQGLPVRPLAVIAVACALIIGLIVTSVVVESSEHAAQGQLAAARAQQHQASVEVADAKKVLAKLLAVGGASRIELISELATDRINWRAWLTAFARVVPAGAQISSLSASPANGESSSGASAETAATVSIIGSDATRIDIQQLVSALRGLPHSTGAELNSVTATSSPGEPGHETPRPGAKGVNSGASATHLYSFQITTGVTVPGSGATHKSLPTVSAEPEEGQASSGGLSGAASALSSGAGG